MLRITSRKQKYHQLWQSLKLQSFLIFPTAPSSSSDKCTGLRKSRLMRECYLSPRHPSTSRKRRLCHFLHLHYFLISCPSRDRADTAEPSPEREMTRLCFVHGSGWHWILKFNCWSLFNQYHLCSLFYLKFISTSTVLTHSDTSLVTIIHKSIWRVSANGWVSSLS